MTPAMTQSAKDEVSTDVASNSFEALAELIRSDPANSAKFQRAVSQISNTFGKTVAVDWACKTQLDSTMPLPTILDFVADEMGEDAPRSLFKDILNNASNGLLLPIARFWRFLCEGNHEYQQSRERISSDIRNFVPIYFRFVIPPTQAINLLKPGKIVGQDAERIQISRMHDYLQSELKPDPEWARVIAQSRLPSTEARRRVEQTEGECGWVDRALELGRLSMMDPLSGEVLNASDGIIAYGRCLYRFDGVEPFFMVTGGPWNAPQGLYLSRSRIVLTFGGEWTGRLRGKELANVLAAYLRARAVRAAAPIGERTKFTLYMPPTNNFAHHHWNFQTGLERAIRLRRVDALAAVRYSGTEFFGSVQDLFPELHDVRIERPRRENVVDPAETPSGGLPLPSAGFYIPRSLTDRIVSYMRGRPRPRMDVTEPRDIPRPAGAPLLWLALRVRGRAWVEQEAGFIEIINRIGEAHSDAMFLLDGFSFPVGEDSSSQDWTEAVALLHGLAERIRTASHYPDRVLNLVGNTMRESVLWAAEVSLYLAPYGTTQHKVGWFSSAPGLVYAPPVFTERQLLQSPGFAAAEISTLPRIVFGTPAVATASVGPARVRKPSNADVSLDPQFVAETLAQMLEDSLASRDRLRVAHV